MASLLRIRHSTERWSEEALEERLLRPLDASFGARVCQPWFAPPDGYQGRRLEMDNGDLALFAWNDDEGFWVGNTETPEALWRTEKFGFDEAPFDVARWMQRELLATLHEESPWLAEYPHVSWFFLPVFLSKDGRETSRAFFKEHAAGFPDATAEEGLGFYERFLERGVLDDHRHVMAGKLGTSKSRNLIRMTAAMGEFNAAYLLVEAGFDIEPEAPVSTGHSIDFRAERDGTVVLVEVTRPAPPSRRSTNSPVAATRQTVETKTDGQLQGHGGGVVLLVDCTSFSTGAWDDLKRSRPDLGHRPAAVYRVRPDGEIDGYCEGSVP
ncbi:MAG: DUF5784 family protein, partial [Halodesulfurarchaeum sp.]